MSESRPVGNGPTPPCRADDALVLASLAGYVLLFAVVALWGLRLDVPLWMFQFLPEAALGDRLWESLYYLHAQPPLMNALVGGAIQLERLGGPPKETTLLVVHFLVGLAIVRTVAVLAGSLLRRPWLRVAAVAALLLDPCFWLALFQAFYPIYELFFLTMLAVAAQRFFAARSPSRHAKIEPAGCHRTGRASEHPSPAWNPDVVADLARRAGMRSFAWCCVWACGLVLTRSLFHPLWAMVVLSWIGGGAWSRRAMRSCGAAALVVLAAWPVKNLVEFGFFGLSSWLGYNVARGLEVERPEVGPAFDFGDSPENRRARALATRQVPDRYRDVPVLADPIKWADRPEIPNLNHFAMLDYGRSLLRRSLAVVGENPPILLAKASVCYRRGLCLYPGRNANAGSLDARVLGTWMEPWTRVHETISVLYLGNDTIERPANGFRVLLPVLLLAVLWRIARRPRGDPGWRLAVLLVWHVLWVIVMVLFVDGFEGNRMRYSTTPFLVLLAAWAIDGLLDRLCREPQST
jgi:hypothetical protein